MDIRVPSQVENTVITAKPNDAAAHDRELREKCLALAVQFHQRNVLHSYKVFTLADEMVEYIKTGKKP